MQLEKTHPSGVEEWLCQECGRRLIIRWPPAYKKIVLEVGDERASHSGGKGGLQIRSPRLTQGESDDQVLSDDLRNALDELDFGD